MSFASRAGLPVLALALIALSNVGCSGDSNQTKTGTTVTKPPEAAAGEKASIDFMRKNMNKGGFTKPSPPAGK